MRRFVNRWLAFILTLGVLLASGATLSSPSYGDGKDPLAIGDPGGGLPGGDPDGPSGPGNRGYGRAVQPRNTSTIAPVGDGGTSLGVWSWRFQVAMRSLISRYFRF